MDTTLLNSLVSNRLQHELKSELQRYISLIQESLANNVTGRVGEYGSRYRSSRSGREYLTNQGTLSDIIPRISRSDMCITHRPCLPRRHRNAFPRHPTKLQRSNPTPPPSTPTLIPGLSTCTTNRRARKAVCRTKYLCTYHILTPPFFRNQNQGLCTEARRVCIILVDL